MFCKNCGHKVNANESFCGNCGGKILQTMPSATVQSEIPPKGVVSMINRATGEHCQFKIGWSWVLFIFSSLLGIPWFMRKIYDIACAWVIFAIFILFLTPDFNLEKGLIGYFQTILDHRVYMLVSFANLALCIYCGLKGNEFTIKRYLKRGYEIVDISPLARR
jgi:hypothetical protein